MSTTIRIAKVVKVHHEHRAVDVVFLDNGWHATGLQVMAPTASTCTGDLDLPEPIIEGETWDPVLYDKRDMLAVVADTEGMPLVLGFVLPTVSEMVFEEKNIRVRRHVSDFYELTNDQGDHEWVHPSGAVIRMGGNAANSYRPSDYDKRWVIKRNRNKATEILISRGSGSATTFVHLKASGEVIIRGATIKLNPP